MPNAVAVWRSPGDDGGWETRCACIWTKERRGEAPKVLLIGPRWGSDGAGGQGSACLVGPADGPGSPEVERRRAQIYRRREAIGPETLATIAAPAALAWLDAHDGRLQAARTIGRGGPREERIVRPVPAPARQTPPSWLIARPERDVETLVLRAAGEGWRVGGSCPVRAWRDSWAERAELGAIAWQVLHDPNTALDQDAFRALERNAERGTLEAQRRYPALSAVSALVRKMLVQTGRAHVAPAPDERTLCAIEIPARLWQTLTAAGPCPEAPPALDLRDRWWLVEIERPGGEELNAGAVWEEAGSRRALAVFVGTPGPSDEAALSVVTWRTTPNIAHVDAGVANLDYPVRVDDPDKRGSAPGMDTVIEALTSPGTGTIARIETAMALHEAQGGRPAPLGPHRASLHAGHQRTGAAGRGRTGRGRLFALERAPEPERAPGAGRGNGRASARAGKPLEAPQRAQREDGTSRMSHERDEHRIATRKRQGLVWLPHAPGWDRLLNTLSLTAELQGQHDWTVTLLEERRGRLRFTSTGTTAVSEALESIAALGSARADARVRIAPDRKRPHCDPDGDPMRTLPPGGGRDVSGGGRGSERRARARPRRAGASPDPGPRRVGAPAGGAV